MHLQASVTLIDTLWNSLQLHFHMKKHPTSTEDLQAIMGLKNQNNNLLDPPPHPAPFSFPLMNEQIKYQSKNKLNVMWQNHLLIVSGLGMCYNSIMAA